MGEPLYIERYRRGIMIKLVNEDRQFRHFDSETKSQIKLLFREPLDNLLLMLRYVECLRAQESDLKMLFNISFFNVDRANIFSSIFI